VRLFLWHGMNKIRITPVSLLLLVRLGNIPNYCMNVTECFPISRKIIRVGSNEAIVCIIGFLSLWCWCAIEDMHLS
jgi:hypothetical protein